MIYEKCIRRGIVINLHDLGVNLASKAHSEHIKHAQMLCKFTLEGFKFCCLQSNSNLLNYKVPKLWQK